MRELRQMLGSNHTLLKPSVAPAAVVVNASDHLGGPPGCYRLPVKC